MEVRRDPRVSVEDSTLFCRSLALPSTADNEIAIRASA